MTKNWTFDHIAFIVKDIDQAMDHFKSIGAEVLKTPQPANWPKEKLAQLKYYEKTPTEEYKLMWGQVKLGQLTIEFHMPVKGNSPWMEYFEKHGEGIDHICFTVDDVDKEKADMAKKGFKTVLTIAEPDGKLADAYYDTRKVGNVIFATMKKGIV